MPDTGATYPGLGSNEDRAGLPAWSNPTNIEWELLAATWSGTDQPSDWLRGSDFGFSVPTDATIVGVKLDMYRLEISGSVLNLLLYLVDSDGVNTGNSKHKTNEYWSGFQEVSYGGASDLWGATLTPAIVNSANFGARMSVGAIGASSCSVTWYKITVYYTVAETYDEKGRLQVILGVQTKSDIATRIETAKIQVALAAQGKVESATRIEIGRTQIVLAAQDRVENFLFPEIGKLQVVLTPQGRADLAAFTELNKLQAILAVQGKSDVRLLPELGREQVIAAVQGSVDSTVLSEVSKEQIIAAILGKTDASILTELAKLQVVLALHNSLDQAHFWEHRLQVILAAQGREDVYIPIGVIDEKGRLQIILVPQGRSDVATFNELDKEQILLVTQGKVVGFRFLELGKEQIALVATGESDAAILSELAKLQVLLALHGSLDQALFSEQLLQIILATQGRIDVYIPVVVILYDETGRVQIILATVDVKDIQIVGRIAKPPAVHDLGKTKLHYTLGKPQVDYTLGKTKVGTHNLGRKV